MPDIIHRIGFNSTETKVYEALSTIKGVSNWWTEEVNGDEQPGGKLEFIFRTDTGEIRGKMMMTVQEMVPAKKVHWKCMEGPDEWVGTDITFDLSLQDKQVILLFGHRNWREPVEFMAHCSMKWSVFLLSLKQYIETGTGRPTPNDLKIDNWN